MYQGSCLCGAVKFTVNGPLTDAGACHCSQCRKQSGHYWAAAEASDSDLVITGAVTWFAATDIAKRGFCGVCGSFLFWKSNDDAATGLALGALDGPTGLHLDRHIFTADKGDYYDIADDVRQEEQET